jgi:hypothetical protein
LQRVAGATISKGMRRGVRWSAESAGHVSLGTCTSCKFAFWHFLNSNTFPGLVAKNYSREKWRGQEVSYMSEIMSIDTVECRLYFLCTLLSAGFKPTRDHDVYPQSLPASSVGCLFDFELASGKYDFVSSSFNPTLCGGANGGRWDASMERPAHRGRKRKYSIVSGIG